MDPLSGFATVRKLADSEGCPDYLVVQALRRLKVVEVGVVGRSKLYSSVDGERVLAELRRLRQRRDERRFVGDDRPSEPPTPRIGVGLPAIPTLPRKRTGDGAPPAPEAPAVPLIGAAV